MNTFFDAPEMKVVVGVGSANTGELAMERALQVATEEPGIELHLVHVLPKESQSSSFLVLDVKQARERLIAHGQRALEAFLAKHPAISERPRILHHVRVGEPAPEIVRLATDLGAYLIVLETDSPRGRLGSIAETVVSLSPRCTVFVARHEPVSCLA